MKVWIDPELCIGCGACEPTCSAGAIVMDALLAIADVAVCTGCEDCMEICPADAIVTLGDDEQPPVREPTSPTQPRPAAARGPDTAWPPPPATPAHGGNGGGRAPEHAGENDSFGWLDWRPGRGQLRRRLRRRLGLGRGD